MFDIEKENTVQALKDCIKLGKEHSDEVIGDTYEPDEATLVVVLTAGLMDIITVRDKGQLVGYWLNMVTRDFISGKIMGKEAAFYLKPEVRGSRAFVKMIKLVEKIAKDKGAVSQLIMFEEGHDSGFAPRLGYEPVEHVYKKNLGDS